MRLWPATAASIMPEAWPRLTPDEIAALAGLDYADAAYRIMRPFLEGDPSLADLEAVLEEAYGSFHHPAIAPLRQIGAERAACSSCFTGRRSPSRTSPCRWWRG